MAGAAVDGDRSICNATRDLLKAAGFLRCHFRRRRKLPELDESRERCLVADMRMPGMTRLELHQALVASGNEIPTVRITAGPETSRAQPGSRAT
jgi:FixJ family two-component response regulator